ncbi:MAG: helix-turn-helix domain-containing protein [Gemmatimonadota bacterium]
MRTFTHDSGEGAWTMHMAQPATPLLGCVLSYHDYTERVRWSAPRIEYAAALVPLIINLGPPFRLSDMQATPGVLHSSFAAGIFDGPVVSESTGPSRCIQVNLTPLGASRLLGLPLGSIVRTVVPLEDIMAGLASELAERLEESPTPEKRFALLDRTLGAMLAKSPESGAEMQWTWDQLEASGGQRDIGGIAEELGWSRKRLIRSFNEWIGVPPKTIARMIRFQRLQSLLRREPGTTWSQAAVRSGYFDQSHLIRDCRQFTGVTPKVWKELL